MSQVGIQENKISQSSQHSGVGPSESIQSEAANSDPFDTYHTGHLLLTYSCSATSSSHRKPAKRTDNLVIGIYSSGTVFGGARPHFRLLLFSSGQCLYEVLYTLGTGR
jgi:hypothetical protein